MQDISKRIAGSILKLKKDSLGQMPEAPINQDSESFEDGEYRHDGATETIIQNPVTGSGSGGIIGR